ncbi:hypothetical protein BFX89_18125 [Escherichia coli]|nr:hypothetical protein BFX89_18125 [Escherichia coli]
MVWHQPFLTAQLPAEAEKDATVKRTEKESRKRKPGLGGGKNRSKQQLGRGSEDRKAKRDIDRGNLSGEVTG